MSMNLTDAEKLEFLPTVLASKPLRPALNHFYAREADYKRASRFYDRCGYSTTSHRIVEYVRSQIESANEVVVKAEARKTPRFSRKRALITKLDANAVILAKATVVTWDAALSRCLYAVGA